MKSSKIEIETSQRSNTSKLRWKILSSALMGQLTRNQASIRRLSSFDLFERREIDEQKIENEKEFDTIQLANKSSGQAGVAGNRRVAREQNVDCDSDEMHSYKVKGQLQNQPDQLNEDKWFCYSLNSNEINFEIKLKFTSNRIAIKELCHEFDNTGNYLWLTEEIMAYVCLKNSVLFDNLNVCELGCGLSAFAGLSVAISSKANYVLLTDKSARCMKNVETIRKANQNSFNGTIVECKQLKWQLMNDATSDKAISGTRTESVTNIKGESSDESPDDCRVIYDSLKNKFDFILCSDCLYFEKSHLLLIETIYNLLKDNGIAIVMAPLRKNTFVDFMKLSLKYFHLKIHVVYDDVVWKLNRKFQKELTDIYKTDQYYPIMCILQKRQNIRA